MAYPCVKWVGGKSDICEKLLKWFPRQIDDYYEPFIGGSSMLIHLLTSQSVKISGQIYASDINPHLINVYNTIKTNVNALIEQLSIIEKEYSNSSKEEYYYKKRDEFNEEHTAAQFIFINKTCFRGLYRVNSNGSFNVPFGNYANPKICDDQNLINLSKIFSNVTFKCHTFENISPKKGDFIYLDPPYHPISKTSFKAYDSGWSDVSEHQLREFCGALQEKDVPFVQSNSACSYNCDLYSDCMIKSIHCRRRINSKKPESKCKEFIIISNKNPLDDPFVRDWINGGTALIKHFSAKQERIWGKNCLEYYFGKKVKDGAWSGTLGEMLVKRIISTKKEVAPSRHIKHFEPDFETKDFVWKVKTRCYHINGTAGEKVLGTWVKYLDVPDLYEKPLKIVLVANQEKEWNDYFGSPNEKKKKILNLMTEFGIEYVYLSSLCDIQ